MPNLEEHCARTLRIYKVEGRDIHSWLDEPSREYAGSHRQFRHDTETVKLVGELFGKTYGKELAENIALDHIMADHEGEVKNRNSDIIINLPENKEIPAIPCTHCRTLLKPSDQTCPNCGAPRTRIIEEFDRAIEVEKIKVQEQKKQLRHEVLKELNLRKNPSQRRIWYYLTPNDPVCMKLLKEDIENVGLHPEFAPEYLRILESHHPELVERYKPLLEKYGHDYFVAEKKHKVHVHIDGIVTTLLGIFVIVLSLGTILLAFQTPYGTVPGPFIALATLGLILGPFLLLAGSQMMQKGKLKLISLGFLIMIIVIASGFYTWMGWGSQMKTVQIKVQYSGSWSGEYYSGPSDSDLYSVPTTWLGSGNTTLILNRPSNAYPKWDITLQATMLDLYGDPLTITIMTMDGRVLNYSLGTKIRYEIIR